MIRLMISLPVLLSTVALAVAQFAFAAAPTTATRPATDNYVLGPDSKPQAGVPKGKVTQARWTESKVFPGTVRDYWVYVPAQYDGSKPAAVMVFQDGSAYVDTTDNGAWRIPDVFDNLIAKKEMPVTIGIFINPGGNETNARANRSFEYDTLSDAYARFLLEEILPEVGKNYKLTTDPEGRAVAGLSSGGICAFTVAWQRPDAFRKVARFYGSFTSIADRPATADRPMQPGGDLYPGLIRKTPPKPLKIFLQDGSADLNNEHGNWWLANQQMLSALQYANATPARGGRGAAATGPSISGGAAPQGAKYEINFAWGDGGHTPKHGGSIFPDVMRWMWSGYTPKE